MDETSSQEGAPTAIPPWASELLKAIAQQSSNQNGVVPARARQVRRKEDAWFEGIDVSEWVEEFEMDLKREGVQPHDWCTEMVANSKMLIRSRLRALDGFEYRNWETFRTQLKEEYREKDRRLAKTTVAYLELLGQEVQKNAISMMDYVNDFKKTGLEMLDTGEATNQQLVRLFLKSFSSADQLAILKAAGINPSVALLGKEILPDFSQVITAGRDLARMHLYLNQVTKQNLKAKDVQEVIKQQFPNVTRRNEDPSRLDNDIKVCIDNLRQALPTVDVLRQAVAMCQDPVLVSGKQNSTQMGHIVAYVENSYPKHHTAPTQLAGPPKTYNTVSFAPRADGQTNEVWCCANESNDHRHAGGCPLLRPLIENGTVHWDSDIKGFRWGRRGGGGDTVIGLQRYQRVGKTQREQIEDMMGSRISQQHGLTSGVSYLAGEFEDRDGHFAEYDAIAAEVQIQPGVFAATRLRMNEKGKQPMQIIAGESSRVMKTAVKGARRVFNEQIENQDMGNVGARAEPNTVHTEDAGPTPKITPSLRKYLRDVPHDEAVAQVTTRVLQSAFQMTVLEALQLMPSIQKGIYQSLPASLAESVRSQLEEAEESKRRRMDERRERHAAKEPTEKVVAGVGSNSRENTGHSHDLQVNSILSGDLSQRTFTSNYIRGIDIGNNRRRISAPLPIARVCIAGRPTVFKALIDTGASLNCMNEKVARDLGLVLNQVRSGMTAMEGLRSASAGVMQCVGWVAVTLQIDGADFAYRDVIFAVFKNLNLEVLLGNEWCSLAQLETHHIGDGSCTCRAHAPDGSQSVRWSAAEAIHMYPAMEEGILSEDSENEEAM
jgi:hypothetical protein